ncbi:MAG: MOSC domain-containing protein [Microbacteriaceae bacterium]
MPSVLAVCVVHQLRPDPGVVGVTAIDKRPVAGPVRVGPYGLFADVQADRKHHGGLDQAVYAYAQEDADYWAAELGRELSAGWFGENLRIEGVDPNAVRVGERWRVGSTELEATNGRDPCQTFARWVGGEDERGWVKRFGAVARTGVYFRVLRSGDLRAGDPIEVLDVPEGAITIRETLRV